VEKSGGEEDPDVFHKTKKARTERKINTIRPAVETKVKRKVIYVS